MLHVLAALIAFSAEHPRCGEMDAGQDSAYVWMECSCGGGVIVRPVIDVADGGCSRQARA